MFAKNNSTMEILPSYVVLTFEHLHLKAETHRLLEGALIIAAGPKP